MRVLYNENDPWCAQWLRNLIEVGDLPDGVVNELDIEDIVCGELDGFEQFHAFAGIGGWPLALKLAGFAGSVWTGSCPCQPFSGAGKGSGFMDKRHLWPAWFWLIEQRRPGLIFGEQVEGPAGRAWLDLVFSDLEGIGYACGAVVFPAAGVGAPHIRSRTYWMAVADSMQPKQLARQGARAFETVGGRSRSEPSGRSDAGGLADADGGNASSEGLQRGGQQRQFASHGGARKLADAERDGRQRLLGDDGNSGKGSRAERLGKQPAVDRAYGRPSPPDSFWSNADWIFCRDDKWRSVESGTFPLAHGVSGRVGLLRAYGNAVCIPQAQVFIEAWLDGRRS